MLAIAFLNIDPVFFSIGPFEFRWYGLAYVVGIILGWRYALYLVQHFSLPITRQHIDDFVLWMLGGVVIGGRLGHVLFYDSWHYLNHPLEIFMTWKGGMSFHGGVIGVIVAILWFCKRYELSALRFADVIATIMPIGLFLGRLANFINGELYGKVTTVPWAVLFPGGGFLPRHPSQLYEAALEGIVLFILLFWSWRHPVLRQKPGAITGLFLLGYGLSRIFVEFFRESDGIGILGMTLGQLLSLPMVIAGLFFLLRRGRTYLNAC